LSHPGGYDLDPVNLRRLSGDQHTRVNHGVAGALADAGPDAWGRKLLEMQRGVLDTPLEPLRLSNGDGTGALIFSESRTSPVPARQPVASATLGELEAAACGVDAGNPVSRPELEQLILAGSPLGGARPKVNVRMEGHEWIAKFQRGGDDMDIPRLEHACLTLAERCGLDVPTHQLVELNGRSTLLVRRFDREGPRRLHYLSLHALLSAERVNATAVRAPVGAFTYGSLAATCRRVGVKDAGAILFRRMLFNVCIGNTDDHLRNHGLLFDGTWRHAPSFDLVGIGGNMQAIGIGTRGRERSIDNAMSDYGRFGLSEDAADQTLDNVVRGLMDAEGVLDQARLPTAHVQTVLNRLLIGRD